MASVFTRIIQGELPAYKIYESERIIAFLALDQVQPGHTLVVPKKEVDHWFEVEAELFAELQNLSQKLAQVIRQSTGCKRVLSATVGFEVHHCHVHLIPAWDISDLNFAKAKKLPPEQMIQLQKVLTEGLNAKI